MCCPADTPPMMSLQNGWACLPICWEKAFGEVEWLNKVDAHAKGNFAVIKWTAGEIKGDKLLAL